MGYGGVAAVLIAMLAALTVLPAALRLLGARSTAAGCPGAATAPWPSDDEHGAWARLARGVMRRPVVVIVGVVVVLLAIASPFLGVKWGSVDYRVLPAGRTGARGRDKLATEFGPERRPPTCFSGGPPRPTWRRTPPSVEAVDGVVDVRPVATEGDTTLLRASWEGNSQTERSQDMVRDLREVEPDERHGAGRWPDRRHGRPDRLGRRPPAVDGADRRRS